MPNSVYSVFTPTKPARITFVERDPINEKLVAALRTPGKQIVVYGPSGSGKSTLLVNKLHQLYENHVTSRCMKGLTFDQIVLDAFDQLEPYYVAKTSSGRETQVGILAEYAGIKATLNTFGGTESVRVIPPQLTPQALGRFLGEANCCWVIEDFHKIGDDEKKKLSQLMKIFMDMADRYDTLKIVTIGAVDSARQVVEYDDEMRNRVAEVQVPLMDEKEVSQIISKGEHALNIKISDEIKTSIIRYSSGVASVCHHLCLNMCIAAGVEETADRTRVLSDEHLEDALGRYIDDASDSLKSVFDRAFRQRRKAKYKNVELILRALCKYNEEGATRLEIHERIKKEEPRYPASNLQHFLIRLQTDEYGGVLRHDPNSGRFAFADPIYRVFALAWFRPDSRQTLDRWTDFLAFLRENLGKELSSQFQISIQLADISDEVSSDAEYSR